MLIPSNATPKGEPPTAKVPTSAPVLASNLVTLLSLLFATQMLVSIERYTIWEGPNRIRTDDRAGAGQQLGHGVAVAIGDPDVGSIEGYAFGASLQPERCRRAHRCWPVIWSRCCQTDLQPRCCFRRMQWHQGWLRPHTCRPSRRCWPAAWSRCWRRKFAIQILVASNAMPMGPTPVA